MSLTELAKRAGVAKSYLSSLERNLQKNPSLQFLEKIAHALEVSVNLLLEDDNQQEEVSGEWLEIIQDAINEGITKEQFAEFLEFQRWKQEK